MTIDCESCNGTGEYEIWAGVFRRCPDCDGVGTIEVEDEDDGEE